MFDILVTAKVHPDLDGVSCTLAYANLLTCLDKSAEGLLFGTPQPEVKYFIDCLKYPLVYLDSGLKSSWKKFILVDASSMLGMPSAVKQAQVIEIIDHRQASPEKEFPKASIQNDLIGAAATIIVERFQKASLLPQPIHAQLLYGAIFHNTLAFNSPNTSERDRQAFSWLEANYSSCRLKLVDKMFIYSTQTIFSDIATAIFQDAKEFAAQNIKIGAYQLVVYGFNKNDFSDQISQAVSKLNQKYTCPISYLSISDIKAKTTYFYVSDEKSKSILTNSLNLKFDSQNWSKSDLLLRKQIMPVIKDYLEKNSLNS